MEWKRETLIEWNLDDALWLYSIRNSEVLRLWDSNVIRSSIAFSTWGFSTGLKRIVRVLSQLVRCVTRRPWPLASSTEFWMTQKGEPYCISGLG